MNFEFDPDVEEMRAMTVAFARRELAGRREENGAAFDADAFRGRWLLAGKQGVVGGVVPVEYGGSGLDAVAASAVMEALGYGSSDTGFAFSVAAHLFASLMPIVEFGTEEQKRRLLPALCSGELIAAHAITEPEAGSDALNLRTRAEFRGDHYVLHGSKCFTTNAPVADVFVVQAATEPGRGFFGLTAFVVEAGDTRAQRGAALHQGRSAGFPDGRRPLRRVCGALGRCARGPGCGGECLLLLHEVGAHLSLRRLSRCHAARAGVDGRVHGGT